MQANFIRVRDKYKSQCPTDRFAAAMALTQEVAKRFRSRNEFHSWQETAECMCEDAIDEGHEKMIPIIITACVELHDGHDFTVVWN